jgi:acyl-coenzyme A synthetase/AMP-(fatty) acid ligase
MCVMRKYDYQTYVNACARYKVTKMLMVPPTAISMAKDPFVKSLDLSSVNQIICSGAPLQAEVVNALTTLLNGVYITQGYG